MLLLSCLIGGQAAKRLDYSKRWAYLAFPFEQPRDNSRLVGNPYLTRYVRVAR